MVKVGEIGLLTFNCRLGVPKRDEISQFRLQRIYWRWSAISCKRSASFGPV